MTAYRLVKQDIERELASPPYPIPGAVVMVGTPEEILYHEAFGFAQVEPKRAGMRRDSIFDVASVTKVVATATAAAICADRGLIDPDAPVMRYLPDHQGSGVEKITLRVLASHTSGFPLRPWLSDQGRCGEAMFRQLLTESPAWEPGTRHHYACRNLILLSTIIERVTGRQFGEFCEAEIFAPLGMNESVFNQVTPSPRIVGTFAPLGESHNVETMAAGRAIGNAGLFTTAGDLALFCQMMLKGGQYGKKRLLSEIVIHDFTAVYTPPEFSPTGFVWQRGRESHHPRLLSDDAFGHGGYTGQALWIDPSLKLFTLVLSNRNHPRDIQGSKIPQFEKLSRIADHVLARLG